MRLIYLFILFTALGQPTHAALSIFPEESEVQEMEAVTESPQVFPSPALSPAIHPAAQWLKTVKNAHFGALFEFPSFYALRPEIAFSPASITKIFIAGTVLDQLGGDYRIPTELIGTVDGESLIHPQIRGTGDPTWGMSEFSDSNKEKIKTWINDLRAAGIQRIIGPLQVTQEDPRWTASQISPPGWASRHQSHCYAARPTSFNFQENCVPGKPNIPQSQAAGLRWIESIFKRNGILLEPARKNPKLTGNAFQSVSYSAPIREIIRPYMKNSINFIGEALFLHLGFHQSQWNTDSIRTVARDTIAHHMNSIQPRSSELLKIWDGCGLSDWNTVTPQATFDYVDGVLRQNYWPDFRNALATAGVDGTLRTRMRGTIAQGKVHGKTGTLGSAVNLIGVIETSKGDEPFVILGQGSSASTLRNKTDQALISTLK